MQNKNQSTKVNNIKKQNVLQILLAAGLSLGVFVVLFIIRNLFPFGKGSILMIDLHSQYVPLLYRFYDVVTGQKNIFMDLTASGGAYLYADTINEMLNPFNYSLLLFGREKIYLAVNVLLALYGIAASASACFCLQKISDKTRAWNVPLSLCYGLSGFMAAQFQIMKWMYLIVLFPLFVAALLRLVKEKKWGAYALLLAYQLMLSLQLGFMTLLFTLFAAGFYVLYERKNAKKAVCALILGTITGVLIASVVLVPNVLQLLNSARGTENSSYFGVMKQHGLDDLFERLYQAFNPVLFVTGLYFVWKAWKKKEFSKEKKYLLLWVLFLVITVIAQPSNLLWHLGSYRCFPVRYAYMIIFSEVLLVKCLADSENKEEKIRPVICTVLTVLICGISIFFTLNWATAISQGFSSLAVSQVPSVVIKLVILLGLMTVAGVIALFAGKWRVQVITIVASVMGGMFFLFVVLPQDYPVRIMNETAYEEMLAGYEKTDERTPLIHREDNVDWPLNATLVSGGRSMTGYFPSGSGKEYASAMEKLGYYTPWVSTRTQGGTMISDAMLAIMRFDINQPLLTEGLVLPVNTDKLLEMYTEWDGFKPLQRQAKLGELLAGKEVLTICRADELAITEDSVLYAEVKTEDGESTEIICLGQYTQGDAIPEIPADVNEVGVLSLQDWITAIRNYQDAAQTETTILDSKAEITASVVRLSNENTLIMPFAYTKGWKVSVDGKTQDAKAVFGGFLGTDLSEVTPDDGNVHTVKFYFIPQGIVLGAILTLAGVLLLLICSWIRKKTDKTIGEGLGYGLFCTVCIVAVIGIYVIPNVGLVVNMAAKVLGIEQKQTIEQPPVRIADTEVTDEGILVHLVEENLMLNKGVKVKADSEENEDFTVKHIKDGVTDDTSKRWSSENNWENNEHWLQVDFGKETEVACVKLFWERTNACKYALEYSHDAKNWQEVVAYDQTPAQKEETILLEKPVEARYLRLHVLDVTKSEEDLSLYYQNISLTEMEVYGQVADSMLVEKPVIPEGTNRVLQLPEVAEGYDIRFGGADYSNLVKQDGTIADTLSDVDAEVGFVLIKDDLEWELPGMAVTIPASEKIVEIDTGYMQAKGPAALEWKPVFENTLLPKDTAIELSGSSKTQEELLQKMADLLSEEITKIMDEADSDSAEEAKYKWPVIAKITFELEDGQNNNLGEEGYEIQIKESEIKIVGNTPRAIRYGSVALTDYLKETADLNGRKLLAQGTLRDYPKYEVRGFGIDVGRRPITMDLLYDMVKELSSHKMNTLQVHLNDNQIITQSDYDGTLQGARDLYAGMRLESDIKNDKGEGITATDLYYTKEEFKQLIEDAKVYGVEIVPEIDTPAHCLAFTKVFPELGMNDDPEAADLLDISKAEAREFGKNLWSEYLTETETTDAVFAECDVLHLGMDEYYGDAKDYIRYLEELTTHVKTLAPEKDLRIWGSFSLKSGDLSGISKDLQMHIWDVTWAEPTDMYEEGFSIINSLSSSLYLIPGGGYDRLDVTYLENQWQPNVFETPERTWVIPAWSDRCLGASYMMWNDWAHLNGEEITQAGLFDRFREPLTIISDKLW